MTYNVNIFNFFRLPRESHETQLGFLQRWMSSHYRDSNTILKKPLVLSEFGKSNKVQGYTLSERNLYINEVYRNIYNFARNKGTIGGALVWQIVADGMESFCDGYEIVLSKNPSTARLIATQSYKMAVLGHMLNTHHNHFSE